MTGIELANAEAAQALAASMTQHGYLRGRVLPDGSVAALLNLLFTRAICLGCHEDGWARRFCFEDRALADLRFEQLQSEDDEPAGFVARRWA